MSLAFNKGPRVEHIVRGQSGVAGEVAKLRKDTSDAFDAMEQSGIHVMRFDGPSTDTVDADGIMTATASVAAPTTYTGADFDGVLAPGTGPAIIRSPKKVTLTIGGATPANWTGGTVTVIGTDADGDPLEEDVVSAAGAGTTTTVNYFASVEQVELPAAAGTGATTALGVAADTAAIASITSAAEAQILDGATPADWNMARIGNRTMVPARRISFVFSNHADWDATTIVVRGRDAQGKQISSNIAVPNGGNATVTTDKFFASIERISVPAQTGVGGTCAVGPLEGEFGLDIDPISDVEAVAVIREASRADDETAWAVPGTAGAVDDSSVTNAAPYGRYTPHSSVAANGVRDYVLAYIPKAA